MKEIAVRPARPELVSQQEALDRELLQFIDTMVNAGEFSKDFAESGVIEDRFAMNYGIGMISAIHVLGSDEHGGGHHLPSMLASNSNCEFGTMISDKKVPPRLQPWIAKYREYRKSQQADENTGVYTAGYFCVYKHTTNPLTGEVNIAKIQKNRGSTMFPDDWLAQKVIEAIVHTVDHGTLKEENGNGVKTYEHIVDGVTIRATTNIYGKIVTAFPIMPVRPKGWKPNPSTDTDPIPPIRHSEEIAKKVVKAIKAERQAKIAAEANSMQICAQ